MEKYYHDALDAGRMLAAAFLGWTITEGDLHVILKLAIAGATLVYMVGKACLVWLHYIKERNNETPCDSQDD